MPTNLEVPPKAFVGGAHELCAICGLPETGDSTRVEWVYPPRSLCIRCFDAAALALQNVESVVIEPARQPYTK
jgi:hypothetical protein